MSVSLASPTTAFSSISKFGHWLASRHVLGFLSPSVKGEAQIVDSLEEAGEYEIETEQEVVGQFIHWR